MDVKEAVAVAKGYLTQLYLERTSRMSGSRKSSSTKLTGPPSRDHRLCEGADL